MAQGVTILVDVGVVSPRRHTAHYPLLLRQRSTHCRDGQPVGVDEIDPAVFSRQFGQGASDHGDLGTGPQGEDEARTVQTAQTGEIANFSPENAGRQGIEN